MQINRYNGLVNQGSTCYLNSLLQTLFMTSEFRQNVYNYMHDPKKIKEKDSIPYQLQKLFVLLQIKKSPAFSKGLLKSFQWTQADSFQQHDVQQFCRVLFQAIEKSHKNSHWVNDLFAGSTISYINCGKHIRQKHELFMDISLPIRDSYTNKQFESLEDCLKQYFKPQNLQDKIECQQCQQKVFVQKGLKLSSLPKILTIQLNRFQLNYETFQREKLNSFLYYPQILQMHRFIKPYAQMQVKGIPTQLKQKMKVVQKEKSSRTTDYGFQNDYDMPPKKIKRKNSDSIQSNKKLVQFFDQEGKDKRQKQQKQLSLEQQKQKNLQILANLKSDKQSIDSKMKKIYKKQAQNLDDDMLFGSGMGFLAGGSSTSWNSGSFSKQGNKPSFQKTQIKFQHDQDVYDQNKTYKDHTYALYAVLVHSGGAYGGHYYAYIRDGQDWFKFDDSSVTKVNRYQMRRYGNFDNTSYGANAYLLFYRDVKSMKQSNVQTIQIPQQLIQKVQNDIQIIKTTEPQVSKREERLLQLTLGVMIKVLKLIQQQGTQAQEQFENIFIQNRFQCTFAILHQKVKNALNIEFLEENWRMRRYNKVQQTMHQIYGSQIQHHTLESFGFRQTAFIGIQTKKSNQQFEQYDPKQIIIKVSNWRPNITLLTEKYLKPQKIYIGEEVSFSHLVKLIKRKFNIQNPVIIKRNFSQSSPITLYSLEQTKKLIELRFFNGLNLYIQPKTQEKKLKWVQEFQSQKFRCLIKYNNPSQGQNRDKQIYFDTRKTLGDLKQKLSQILNLEIQNFRIKKSKQSVSQLTAYNKKLTDLKFINNQFIFLQIGKSSKGSVIIRKGIVQIIDDKIQFNLLEQTIIEIDSSVNTVGELKAKMSQMMAIPVERIRIRQYKAYQFAQIYRPSELVMKIKQKSLVWELLDQQPPKGLQIYLRVFNIMELELSCLKQVYIDRQASYEQLTYILEQQSGISSDKILVWKALSNYVQKQILLDCEWIETKFIKKTLKQQPLYIGNDGQIIIIKQANEPYKAKLFQKTTNSANRQKDKETQLKITVIEEENQQTQNIQQEAIKQTHNVVTTTQSKQLKQNTSQGKSHNVVTTTQSKQLKQNTSQGKSEQYKQ